MRPNEIPPGTIKQNNVTWLEWILLHLARFIGMYIYAHTYLWVRPETCLSRASQSIEDEMDIYFDLASTQRKNK